MNDLTLLPDIKLRLNINHPNLEDCYIYGYECAAGEIKEADNPFSEGSKEFEQWLEGWWAGFYSEEPLFPLSGQLEEVVPKVTVAANDHFYHHLNATFLVNLLKITGALAATALVGYQVFELVA